MRGESSQREFDSKIFEDALALPVSQRGAYVAAACSHPGEASRLLSILGQIDRLESFMERGLTPGPAAPSLSPGTLLANRFRIVNLAGFGGMGEVYCAHDELLNVRRALKICRGLHWSQTELFHRLKDEVRIACRITHPNVCRIHDLFPAAEPEQVPLFLTMEWLEGQTLAQYLKSRGSLPQPECLALLAGIAEGLAAIHAQGIVHRDLKPSNIFLVSDSPGSTRPVITDFGLATDAPPARPSSAPVEPGELAGTPDYMAPEQFLGERCSPSTDVYALGLISFELLTGSRPHLNGNILQLALRRIAGQPLQLPAASSEIPPQWKRALERALSPTPASRFQDPRSFVSALVRRPLLPKLSRRTILVCGISSAAVALFAAISRYRGYGLAGRQNQIIMLTATTSAEGDSELKLSANIASQLLRAQLAQSPRMSVLPSERAAAIWQRLRQPSDPPVMPANVRPSTSRDIALRAGASLVLFSSLDSNGGEPGLHLRLERLGDSTTAILVSDRLNIPYRASADLPDVVDKAARWIRASAGESTRDIDTRGRRSEELTTPYWQALKEFSLGDSEWSANRPGPAILHFKAALSIDPDFAAASARVADILMANGQPDDAYGQYANAVRVLTARNLTDRESLKTRGLFALDVGLNQEAQDIFQRYSLEFPSDPLPIFYRAGALDALGRPAEALEQFSEAISMAPSNPAFVAGRCRHYLETGNLELARRDCAAARKITSSEWMDQHDMAISFASGDIAAAQATILAMRNKGSLEFQSKSYALEACLLAEKNDLTASRECLRKGFQFDSAHSVPATYSGVKQRLLAQLLLQLGDIPQASRICRDLLRDARAGHGFRLQIAVLLAELGRFDEAARQAKFPDEPQWPVYLYWRRRLEFEFALRDKDARRADEILTATPAPPSRHVFPAHLIRASLAMNDPIFQRSLRDALKNGVGPWWLEPERNPPGFFRQASKTLGGLNDVVHNSKK